MKTLLLLLQFILVLHLSADTKLQKASLAPGVDPEAAGIVVIKPDNVVDWKDATAYQYSYFKASAPTFKLQFLKGGETSGFLKNTVRLDFGKPISQVTIDEMEKFAKAYPKSAPILTPRLNWLKKELVHPTAAPKPPSIPEVKYLGITYKDVRPLYLKEGRLVFSSENGSGPRPAFVDGFTLQTLQFFANLNPELMKTDEFQQLLSTYVDALIIGVSQEKGVKILEEVGDQLTLLTNRGVIKASKAQLTKEGLAKLQEAKEIEAVMKAAIQQKLKDKTLEQLATAKQAKDDDKFRQDQKARQITQEKILPAIKIMAGIWAAKTLLAGSSPFEYDTTPEQTQLQLQMEAQRVDLINKDNLRLEKEYLQSSQ
jgi:hypothetical protein